MKYKVIDTILDGVIVASKSNITCLVENSIQDDEDCKIECYPDLILDSKIVYKSDSFWNYSKKEWDKLNKGFLKIRNEK